jgi:cobalamin biosynthesis protein CbiG
MAFVLGIGCRRGVSCEDISTAVEDALKKVGIGMEMISGIASCDIKSDEKGLLEFSEKNKLKIKFFPGEELKEVEVPNPSERVKGVVGAPSVSEAAALLASGGKLVLEKQKYGNITVALAAEID